MAQTTSIEWTDCSWNPVTGCTKISSGCANCYAERMAIRLHAMGVERYRSKFQVTIHPEMLESPLKWKEPRRIFVNSMSDLFHEEVSDDFILRVFRVMNLCRNHTFQVLTKRSKRLLELSRKINWTSNIWMGVSVENTNYIERVEHLHQCGAIIKFVSCEPLLSDIPNLPLEGIHWVIVGGESGPRSRPMKESWAVSIRDQCLNKRVNFFFKQWGGWNKKKNGRLLVGKKWDQYPAIADEA